MKAISLKAWTGPQSVREAGFRDMAARFVKFVTKNSLTIAVVSATVAFTGCLAGSDTLMHAATAVALAAIYPQTAEKKGGER